MPVPRRAFKITGMKTENISQTTQAHYLVHIADLIGDYIHIHIQTHIDTYTLTCPLPWGDSPKACSGHTTSQRA